MNLSRRGWLGAAAAIAAGAGSAASARAEERAEKPTGPAGFRFGLNTSTLQGHKLTLDQEIDLLIEAGYDAVEPWIRELEQHAKAGKSLADLKKKLADHGKAVPSAIGFFEWAVDDEDRRKKALEEARRAMDLVAQVGGTRIAAPPVGVTDRSGMDPRVLADRLLAVCAVGEQAGIRPELELWGFSRTLGRLGEVVQVAIEADCPDLPLLLDVFHLYKGGSALRSIAYLDGAKLPVIHFNDYPADPPRASIGDAQRVYPGDGVAPLADLVRTLRDIRFDGYLSLELFNRDYWKQDALVVARTGLEKMRAVADRALGS